MAFKQSKLNQIPQRNKDLAFGYIHDHERNHENIIPIIIVLGECSEKISKSLIHDLEKLSQVREPVQHIRFID